ncbi:MAG: HEAT repeat domain-containing protein [Planctomycetes bacterium]|nr:HEAT repeat domain-containing protein [Planctomycetota bacterium]
MDAATTLGALALCIVSPGGQRPVEASASRASIEEAIRALGDANGARRAEATDRLLEAGESARAALEAARESPDPEIRERVEWLFLALRWRGAVTPEQVARIPGLVRRLADARGEDLLRLLEELHEVGTREALPALHLLLADETRVAGLEAAIERSDPFDQPMFRSALRGYALPELEPDLLALAHGPHALLRRGAVEALGDLGTPRSLEALRELKGHPDPETAAAALRGLERSDARVGIEELLRLARDPSGAPERREEAVRILGERGERRAVPDLVDLLAEPSLCTDAAGALGAFRAPEAAPALRALLEPPFYMGDSVAWALARCAPGAARETLLRILGEPKASEVTKGAVLAGLRGSKDPSVARLALALVSSPSSNFLVVEAIPFLELLPAGEAAPVLSARLESDAVVGAPRVAAQTLARLGGPGREALRRLADREGIAPGVRAAALAALARVAEPSDGERALRYVEDREPAVRGAGLRLLGAARGKEAHETVLRGIASLRQGKAPFRPGLADGLRALAACGVAGDGERILEVAREEPALDVKVGALEAMFELGDSGQVRALLAGRGSPLKELSLVAAREIARRGWKECPDLIEPLLGEGGAIADFSDGMEPSLLDRRPLREKAIESLAALFRVDPGGSDPAGRARAWKAFLAAQPRRR